MKTGGVQSKYFMSFLPFRNIRTLSSDLHNIRDFMPFKNRDHPSRKITFLDVKKCKRLGYLKL